MLKIHVKLALYVSFEDRKLCIFSNLPRLNGYYFKTNEISEHWSSYKQDYNYTLVYGTSNLRVESNTSEIMKTTRTKL